MQTNASGKERCRKLMLGVWERPRLIVSCIGPKLQALVYDILPPTTGVTDYAICLEKLSANGHLFVGAQMAVSL